MMMPNILKIRWICVNYHTYFLDIESFYYSDTDDITASNPKPLSDPLRTPRIKTSLSQISWCPNITFKFDIFNFRKTRIKAKSNNEVRSPFATNIDSHVHTQPDNVHSDIICSSAGSPKKTKLLKSSTFLSWYFPFRTRNAPKDSNDFIKSIELPAISHFQGLEFESTLNSSMENLTLARNQFIKKKRRSSDFFLKTQ